LIGFSNANWVGNWIFVVQLWVFFFPFQCHCMLIKQAPKYYNLISTKVEYISMTLTTKEAIWLNLLLEKVGEKQMPTTN
jgi:hypothetical protein